MSEVKKLYRSRSGRVFGGVCSGLAAYLNVDPMLIRLAAVALAFVDGIGLAVYLVMWIVVPDEETQNLEGEAAVRANLNDIGAQARGLAESLRSSIGNGQRSMIIGGILILLGIFFLVNQFAPYLLHTQSALPILLIAIGGIMLAFYARRR